MKTTPIGINSKIRKWYGYIFPNLFSIKVLRFLILFEGELKTYTLLLSFRMYPVPQVVVNNNCPYSCKNTDYTLEVCTLPLNL